MSTENPTAEDRTAEDRTAEDRTADCLARIDAGNARINAVLALCTDALEQARASDRRTADGNVGGPLEGLPVLVKDNIAVGGQPTTAGSRALVRSAPPDATVVERLRTAGAVIIGKANLSEWANFRSTHSTSGWSALGGQTRNPHATDRSTSGSSSGSAAALAAGFVPLAIGTETDGSILSPAALCGVVGFKPTLGTVPGAGIVPISVHQDVAGPMARTVADAALLYAVMAAVPMAVLRDEALRGARVGVWIPSEAQGRELPVLDDAIEALARAGAQPVPVTLDTTALDEVEMTALLSEFHHEIDAYLAAAPDAEVHSLAELIAFNTADDVELSVFGQEIFEEALTAPPIDDPAYRAARAATTSRGRALIDDTLAAHGLDVILTITNDPAWPIQPATGDSYRISTTSPAAAAGYPTITVPAGAVDGLPIGVSFIGTGDDDPRVLDLAHALEQALAAKP